MNRKKVRHIIHGHITVITIFVRMGKIVAENKTGYEFGTQFDFRHHCLQEYWNAVIKYYFEMPRRKMLREYKGINRNINFGHFISYLESLQMQRDDTTDTEE